MTLEDLKNIKISDVSNLRYRYILGCKQKKILSLYDLVVYDRNFLDIPDCGKSGSDILYAIKLEYIKKLDDKNMSLLVPLLLKNKSFHIYDILNQNQQTSLELVYQNSIKQCPNILLKKRLKDISCKSFFNKYRWDIATEKKFKNIRVDESYRCELIEINNICSNAILSYYSIDNVCSKLVESKNETLGAFKELEKYIEEKLDRSKRNINIFLHSFNIIDSYQYIDINSLANKYTVTQSCIGMNRKICFQRIFSDNSIVFKLFENRNWSFYIDKLLNGKYYITVEDIAQDCQNIKNNEDCHLSIPFIMYVLSRVSDKYIFSPNYKIGEYDIKPYLLNKDLLHVIDIQQCKNTIHEIFETNICSYTTTLTSFIKKELLLCISPHWIDYELDIKKIIRDILSKDPYFVVININESFVVNIGTKTKIEDIVYRILKDNGERMHIDEIYNVFRNNCSSREISLDQLKRAINKSGTIERIGRTHFYELKERNPHTNTIRDDVVDFLNQQKEPQPISNIYKYVSRYCADTNERSIQSSISDNHKFIIFEGGLYGLRSKTYDVVYKEQNIKRKTFEQRLTDLELFIAENHRYPSSYEKNVGETEASLGRWWYRVIGHRVSIPKNVSNKINELITQQHNQEYSLNINDLTLFILSNKHFPYSDSEDIYEQMLSEWCQAQLKKENKQICEILEEYAEFNISKEQYLWQIKYREYEDYILKNKKIPTKEEGEEELEQWFFKYKEDFENYNYDGSKWEEEYMHIIQLRDSVK